MAYFHSSGDFREPRSTHNFGADLELFSRSVLLIHGHYVLDGCRSFLILLHNVSGVCECVWVCGALC